MVISWTGKLKTMKKLVLRSVDKHLRVYHEEHEFTLMMPSDSVGSKAPKRKSPVALSGVKKDRQARVAPSARGPAGPARPRRAGGHSEHTARRSPRRILAASPRRLAHRRSGTSNMR